MSVLHPKRLRRGPGLAVLLLLGLHPAMIPAAELTYSELRIRTAFWDDAVFVNIVDSAEAASATSITVASRVYEISETPPPLGHHQHFYGNDAATLTASTPGQLGGDLRFYGDWGLRSQTVFYSGWAIGVETGTDIPGHSTGNPWSLGPVTVEAGTWVTRFPEFTGDPINTIMADPFSGVGSNGLTPGGYGVLTLVTPMKFESVVAAGLPVRAIGELTLVFAPEPDVFAGFVAGAALLLGLGRRRLRRYRHVSASDPDVAGAIG